MLLLAAQLDSALTPRRAPKPVLPKIDENACPFEGCQFGKWTAQRSVPLYSTWKSDRVVLRTIANGETVTAITGTYITNDPMQIEVTASIPEYGLKPGDIVFGYMDHGEGVFSAWFNGYWVEDFDGSGVQGISGSGCMRNCNAIVRKAGRGQWWVKLKTKNGVIGWVEDTDNFEGKDSLAGPD